MQNTHTNSFFVQPNPETQANRTYRMKLAFVLLSSLLLLQGSLAQEACDPATSGTALIDLTNKFGELACKVPADVNLVEVMGTLTGTLTNLEASQLQQLAPLLDLFADIDPTSLTPFLSLSADELDKTIPLLAEVPVETLKVALPLLTNQDPAVVGRMLKFLKLVSLEKLQQLSPLFGRLTEGQVKVLLHALNVMPDHAIEALIKLVQALGPVTDAGVAVKKHLGLFPSIKINAGKGASSSVSSSASASASASAGKGSAGKSWHFKLGGRRLAQACDPAAKGIEVGIGLLEKAGPAVCKFGPDALKPVLEQTIDSLLKQTPEQLSRLPQLSVAVAMVDPKTLGSISRIPQSTLKELIPVLQGIPADKLTTQLKTLAAQDKATIDKMVYFLKATPASQMPLLVGMFAKLTDKQVDQMAKLMNALSPGQIFLTIHLLDTFGFTVDAIAKHIPDSTQRGDKGFMIGPIKVVSDKN